MFFKHNLGEKSTTWQTTENIIKPVLVIAWVWPSSPQSSWCRAGSMNALADKVHKQEVPCTQWYWYARHTMATLFINHPYISSSGTPVDTKFYYCYLCRDALWFMNNVAMVWSAYQYHCVHGTSCLCTLSASAFIEPALYTSARFLFRN